VVVVPETAESVNHEALSPAVQVKVPPVGFVRVNVWGAGFVPPAVPLRVRLVGVSRIDGVAVEPDRARLTGICLTMPPPEMVAAPL
jgi:hypothetical protein